MKKKSDNNNNQKIPPCVVDEVNFCRGCPGWSFMIKAQKEGIGIWKNFPIHCSVTGITISNENNFLKK